MRTKLTTVAAIIGLLLPAALASARPDYCEGPQDAGENTGSSQMTNGSGPLEHIHGKLNGPGVAAPDFEDMFLINITDPLNFRARIVTGDAGPDALPQLWLFRGPAAGGPPEGLGLLGNNGVDVGFEGALLLNESTDMSNVQITQAGLYHLAISGQQPPPPAARAPAGGTQVRRVKTEGGADGPCFGPFIAPVVLQGDTCLEMNLCSLANTQDTSFEVTIPVAGDWTFTLCGAAWDTLLFLGEVCCTAFASNDDACGLASELTLFLAAGNYFVTVEGGAPGACGPFELLIDVAGGPPTGHVPQSSTGENIFEFGPGFEVSGPDGPGGAGTIDQWGDDGDFGDYTVDLRGVSFIDDCPGDIDESGARDFGDIIQILSNWGDCPQCAYDEDFDDYLAGMQLIPQQPCFPVCPADDSWQPWDGLPGAGLAIVSNARSRSQDNSLLIQGPDDLVRTFGGVETGVMVFTAYQYVPGGFTGTTAFLMLNTYTDASDANWSLQVLMDGATNTVSDFNGAGVPLPLVRNRWAEIRVVIDLDADTQRVFYDDEHLLTKSWTEGATGGGALDIAAIDLFANGSTPVFYDDLSLCPLQGPDPCPSDLNLNDATDFGDIVQLLGLWGPCPP